MATIAIQDTFLEAFSQLPKAEQKRTQEMIKKLREDAPYSSLNLERYKEAVDPRVYSIRVNDTYRTIVVRPDKSDMMLLVWVDHHDDAYRWAKRKRFTINPNTGVIQMWSLEEVPPVQSEESKYVYGLYSKLSDQQMKRLGVPAEMVAEVRKVQSIEELEKRKSQLPQDVFEALLYLAHGEEFEEVVRFMEELRAESEQLANQSDSSQTAEKVTQNIHSSGHIVVISDDEHLNDILAKPLEKWRIFLHPSQKVLVERNYNGSVRVLGGAGTGKTVVALHRARYLARHLIKPNEKILLTTYHSHLTDYLLECLKTICSKTDLKKIDVLSIDQLASRIVEQIKDIEPKKVIKPLEQLKDVWATVCRKVGYPLERLKFVMQEYEQVIQFNSIETWEEYRQIARVGRGVRISVKEKERVWQVVTQYKKRLDELGWLDFILFLRIARQWLEQNPGAISYRAAIVDEAQDFHMEAFKLLRTLVPPQTNDLFIVGDPHQCIYPRKVVLHHCGIHVRGPRSKRLRINYRTTEQIREQAVARLSGFEFDDLDGGKLKGKYTSLIYGEPPERCHFASEQEEYRFLVDKIKELLTLGIKSHEIAVLVRTNKMVEKIKAHLRKHLIPTVTLKNRFIQSESGVNCGKMSRSKGLEFRIVFLVGINQELFPPKSKMVGMDQEGKRELEKRERSLLYMASTRARDKLFVTSHGVPSPIWGVQE